MDFTRDEGQNAVAEVVVSLLEREPARDIELWPSLIETGLLSLALVRVLEKRLLTWRRAFDGA